MGVELHPSSSNGVMGVMAAPLPKTDECELSWWCHGYGLAALFGNLHCDTGVAGWGRGGRRPKLGALGRAGVSMMSSEMALSMAV
jgi:hypothetical protein